MPNTSPPTVKKELYGWIGVTVFLLVNAWFLNFNAFRGFNFFDFGCFMDATWRIMHGQKPYTDFIFFVGPVHLYMCAIFYLLFGFGKWAVLVHLVAVSSALVALTYRVARKYLSIPLAVLTSVLTGIAFYWPVSHPWYDQSAHFWGLLAFYAYLFWYPFERNRQAFWVGVLSGSAVIISLMTKTNVGTTYIPLIFFMFLISPNFQRTVPGFFVGAFSALIVLLVCLGNPAAFYNQTFQTFSIPSQTIQRFLPFVYIPTYLLNEYWVGLLVMLYAIRSHWKKVFRLLILSLGVYALAIFTTVTGSMKTTANIPLWGPFMMLVFIAVAQVRPHLTTTRRQIENSICTGLLVILSFLLICNGALRGFALEAWTYGNIDPFGTYPMKTKQLKGWLANQRTGEAVDHLVAYLDEYASKDDSLLVLTDLQILYLLTHHQSYKGIPFNFADGKVPSPGPQTEQVRRYILSHPPDWVVTHRNPLYQSLVSKIVLHLGLQEFLEKDYASITWLNDYILLKKIKDSF
ncbi:MAG: hypothetical protein COV74_03105 [Candidatus Omnitrophica bacterium CG11_big_fil_rev_8_21_14_0_20_45_26]|uniref:Glycosyltransferase RgtA/B/C/D-like domain-containing protein n=1 Tax=Candidatus Abzuiibacterium crystallinum TaxID=1974748 RepID=A0A2H0LQW2_9BACT|nr:MAG: hypothetical protein COV74_03105 [Candidatus Omnitrophica bacterium CG11_big_fil_rev_8_21_14_0_20_45_26]PIW64663.1 MAG: hypothetical protein COW12_05130 [Candidatus Omnitrophica bacterium CG12_big_fil_rev_8_21_14_0_65_45_16]